MTAIFDEGSFRDQIPEEFYRGRHPVVNTVAELIEQLQRLPGDLPVQCSLGDAAELIVYSVLKDPYLCIEEHDDDDDFDDEWDDDEYYDSDGEEE